ncbi:Armadillo-type fold [Phytophthora cinnamomi]|uniref:Armadillo-type fold n=1 Tax=Phytophthora cinnamomi TaxID=4785 RepID=UPI0035593C77|nr:Armadillo-type fold [Phytophthora cinnamomi]
MNERSSRHGKRREVTLPYEKAYPWEDERGSTVDRTVEVNAEAKRVYEMQEQLLPTLALDRPLDPAASDHLQDVGRRVLILRDTTKRSRKKNEAEQSPKQSPKRVIPSRFPEITPDLDEEDRGDPDRVEEEEDPVVTDGRIATMLMDQEWDTRGWNATKIQTAVDTLYEEIEHCEDDSRRDLATTMLLRLMETHEGRCCGLRRDLLTKFDQQGVPDTLQTHEQHQNISHGSTSSSAGRVVCARAVQRKRSQ